MGGCKALAYDSISRGSPAERAKGADRQDRQGISLLPFLSAGMIADFALDEDAI